MKKNVRLRVLYVMELFVEQTDADNGVTMKEILDWLEEHDLTGERKSIYEDIYKDLKNKIENLFALQLQPKW